MKTIIAVTAFCCIVLLAGSLFVYVIASKRKKATRLYKAAAAEESRGNYMQAINLYEQYLQENADETQQVGDRVKTLRSLIMPN